MTIPSPVEAEEEAAEAVVASADEAMTFCSSKRGSEDTSLTDFTSLFSNNDDDDNNNNQENTAPSAPRAMMIGNNPAGEDTASISSATTTILLGLFDVVRLVLDVTLVFQLAAAHANIFLGPVGLGLATVLGTFLAIFGPKQVFLPAVPPPATMLCWLSEPVQRWGRIEFVVFLLQDCAAILVLIFFSFTESLTTVFNIRLGFATVAGVVGCALFLAIMDRRQDCDCCFGYFVVCLIFATFISAALWLLLLPDQPIPLLLAMPVMLLYFGFCCPQCGMVLLGVACSETPTVGAEDTQTP